MGLHDIDRNNDNRLTPSVNSPDNVEIRMSHNTMGNTYRNSGLDVTQRMVFKQGLLLTYDSEDRVSSVYGYIPELSAVPVQIIAKEGFDVFVDLLGLTPPEV